MTGLRGDLPLYYQVLNDLLEKIRSGELPEKCMLTPEIDLAKQYNVSRNTIRHAIGLLSRDGYLMRIPGKGTFITNPLESFTQDQWVVSSIEDLIEETKKTEVSFERMELLDDPPEFVIRDLELKKWNKVGLFQGIKYRRKKVTGFLQVYLPYEIAVQIDPDKRGHRTLLLYQKEELGIDFTQVNEHMTIEKITQEDAERLQTETGNPKVVIKRIYYHEDQPFEVSVNHIRGDQFYLLYSLKKTH